MGEHVDANQRNTNQRNANNSFINPFPVSSDAASPHRMRNIVIVVVCVVALIGAMIAAGFGTLYWRRRALGGSSVVCQLSGSGRDYCIGGITPVQASGPQLSDSEAGPYFSDVIAPLHTAADAVRLAAVGGDLTMMHEAAVRAQDVANNTVDRLSQRAWPDAMRTAINMIILECQEWQSIYANLATNTNPEAIDYLVFTAVKPSGAEDLVRSHFDLDPTPTPAMPIEITKLEDADECQGSEGDQQVVMRCLNVTVVSKVPVPVTDVSVRMALIDPDGTIRSSDAVVAYFTDFPNTVETGSSVVLQAKIDPSLVKSGSRLSAGTWSVTDAEDQYHDGDFAVETQKSGDNNGDDNSGSAGDSSNADSAQDADGDDNAQDAIVRKFAFK